MGNHFHLLITMMRPEDEVTDDEVLESFQRRYGDEYTLMTGKISFYRQKWTSLSEYVKEFKSVLAWWTGMRNIGARPLATESGPATKMSFCPGIWALRNTMRKAPRNSFVCIGNLSTPGALLIQERAKSWIQFPCRGS